MDWLSIVLIVAIGLLTWQAYRNGFVREIVSLSSVILAIPLAGIFYDDLYPKVHPLVDNEALANLVSFLAIFLAVVVGGLLAGYLLKGTVNALNLGSADRVAGAAFGFAKGVLLAQVLLIALVAFPRPDIRDEIDDSPVAETLLDAAPAVLAILPGAFDRAIDTFLSPARSLDDRLDEEAHSGDGP
jgi:membrane protein required for colicin V production